MWNLKQNKQSPKKRKKNLCLIGLNGYVLIDTYTFRFLCSRVCAAMWPSKEKCDHFYSKRLLCCCWSCADVTSIKNHKRQSSSVTFLEISSTVLCYVNQTIVKNLLMLKKPPLNNVNKIIKKFQLSFTHAAPLNACVVLTTIGLNVSSDAQHEQKSGKWLQVEVVVEALAEPWYALRMYFQFRCGIGDDDVVPTHTSQW